MRQRILVAAGLALLSLALVLWAAWLRGPDLIAAKIQEKVQQQIVWQPNSPRKVFDRFERDDHPGDPPTYVNFYLFNITNLDAARRGAKPQLQEVGPYVYLQHRVRLDPTFTADGRVRFHEYCYHVPAPASQGGRDPERDVVTTLNLPLAGALETILEAAPAQAAPWLALLAGLVEASAGPAAAGLFASRTAAELLWGYDDALLALAARVIPGVNPRVQLVANATSPAEAAAGGASVVDTGARNISRVAQFERWRGLAAVTSWAPPHVEAVRGGDGRQFRPGLSAGDAAEVWVGDLYRAARLLGDHEVTVQGALRALRLLPDASLAAPDARYFQALRGLMNITSPAAGGPGGRAGKPGPPLFLSLPHFCETDPAVGRGVAGLACDPERHSLYLDVEPTTGIAVRAAKRLQLSSWYGARWRALDPLVPPSTFLPIFWAEELSRASDAQLSSFGPLARALAASALIQTYAPAAAAACGLLALLLLAAAAAGRRRSAAGGGDADAAGYAVLAEEAPDAEELAPPSPPADDAPAHQDGPGA